MERVGEAGTLFVVLQLAFERRVAHCPVPDEVDALDFDLRPFVHVEGEVNQLRPAGDFLDFRRDLGELEAFVAHHVADDARHLADQTGIDERVEADLRVGVLQLLVDLRDLDLLRPDVIHDLDALALLHVVGDDLADRPVGELVVADVDEQVVEEVRVPEASKVVLEDLLGRLVVRDPIPLRRRAGLQLDVKEVGLGLDDRLVALRLEARRDEQHHGPAAGGRFRERARLLTANGHQRHLRRCLGRYVYGGEDRQSSQHCFDFRLSAGVFGRRRDLYGIRRRLRVTPACGQPPTPRRGDRRASRPRGRPRLRRPADAPG